MRPTAYKVRIDEKVLVLIFSDGTETYTTELTLGQARKLLTDMFTGVLKLAKLLQGGKNGDKVSDGKTT